MTSTRYKRSTVWLKFILPAVLACIGLLTAFINYQSARSKNLAVNPVIEQNTNSPIAGVINEQNNYYNVPKDSSSEREHKAPQKNVSKYGEQKKRPLNHSSSQPQPEHLTEEKSVQIMNNSPNGVQIGGDNFGNISTDSRRVLSQESIYILNKYLGVGECKFKIGTIGMGGEQEELAQSLKRILSTKCNIGGVYRNIGGEVFYGVQIRYSPNFLDRKRLYTLENAFEMSEIKYVSGVDESQPDDLLYIYVGLRNN